jgi:hypothetical protein
LAIGFALKVTVLEYHWNLPFLSMAFTLTRNWPVCGEDKVMIVSACVVIKVSLQGKIH